MTQVFNEQVKVDGSADEPQLIVQGHSAQTEPLQDWQTSSGDPVARMTGDGRLQVGDFNPDGTMATDDALIEAHRDGTSSKPKRGIHTKGAVTNATGAEIAWSVHEVTLDGATTDLTQVIALRAGVEVTAGQVGQAIGMYVRDVDGASENYAIYTGKGKVRFGDAMEACLFMQPNLLNQPLHVDAGYNARLIGPTTLQNILSINGFLEMN